MCVFRVLVAELRRHPRRRFRPVFPVVDVDVEILVVEVAELARPAQPEELVQGEHADQLRGGGEDRPVYYTLRRHEEARHKEGGG